MAADEARRLPDRAIELPMLAVSTALQASLRAQQNYARLAARGDDVLHRRRVTDEPPPWATFDEPVGVEELRRAAEHAEDDDGHSAEVKPLRRPAKSAARKRAAGTGARGTGASSANSRSASSGNSANSRSASSASSGSSASSRGTSTREPKSGAKSSPRRSSARKRPDTGS
jgi:hypothetical protein